MESAILEIVTFQASHQSCFELLNRHWIEKYFSMEPIDFEVLQNPLRHILAPGGNIFMAKIGKDSVGTVAMKNLGAGIYELTKMAVDEEYQGRKIGQGLAESAIEWSRKVGAKKVVLYSNTQLSSAISLYRKLGFLEVPLDGPYKRSNIKMELELIHSSRVVSDQGDKLKRL